MKIFSGAWVVPVDSPVIRTGSVVVGSGRIIDIGPRAEILQRFSGFAEEWSDAVLMPGLINGHAHLELSHLPNISSSCRTEKFTDWVFALIKERGRKSGQHNEITAAFTAVLDNHFASGVALVADVGNDSLPLLDNPGGKDTWPEIFRMREFLAPTRQTSLTAWENIGALDERITACCHAPYSTVPDVLVGVKNRCRRLNHIYSIHAGETIDEIEFLQSGTGCFRAFLENLDRWDNSFAFGQKGFCGAIDYLDHLNILDEKTLMVHCVHASESELELIRKRGAHICLCPGSNDFLKVGVAPVEKILSCGILPALGTDSAASNVTLDMWHEMKVTAELHPQLERKYILAMATLGGAQALAKTNDYGSLTLGKKAQILRVSSSALSQCRNGNEVIETLVQGGRPSNILWSIG